MSGLPEYLCHFCDAPLHLETDDIEGWIAYVSCPGCDMQGPTSQFKYACPKEAKQDALDRWAHGINSIIAKAMEARQGRDGEAGSVHDSAVGNADLLEERRS